MSAPLNAPLDMTAILCDYLREHDGISAIVGDRVASESPSDFDDPWIRVQRIEVNNATGNKGVAWLMAYYMQIDCYAGVENRPEDVSDLEAVAWDAVLAMQGADLEGAVVTDVGVAGMPSPADEDLKPARHRRIFDAEIFAHPKP